MEIFEVLYRGKKVNAIKRGKGEIYVILPTRRGEKGNEFQEIILRDSKGWKFSSSLAENPEYGFKLWIRDDGKLAYCSHNSDKILVTKEEFNPDLQNGGKLNNIATELYNTVEQLKAFEKHEISALDICKLRMEKLKTTLKLLGYYRIEQIKSGLDDSKVYLSLARVRKQLKDYINLGIYVHYEGRRNQEDIIRVNIPKGMSSEDFKRLKSLVEDENSADEEFIEEQDEKREKKQDILPDYYKEMSKKMPYYDWLIYSKVVGETAQLLLELNADLINSKSGLQINDSSELTGTALEDRISELIDSKEFVTACEIENRFCIREGSRLIKELDSILQGDDETIRSSSIMKILKTIKEEEATIIAQRNTINNDKTQEGIGIDD